jgi:hypothetical protein
LGSAKGKAFENIHHAPDDDLNYKESDKDEMINNLEKRLGKTREERISRIEIISS